MRPTRVCCLTLLGLFVPFATASASCASHENLKTTASDGSHNDHYGDAVAIDGDIAVVGAPSENELGTNAGAAYILRRVDGAWVEVQKLTASDASTSGYFGTSVAVSEDRVVVGSLEHSLDGIATGAAYVFHRNGSVWEEQQKLTLTSRAPLDRFGASVAIDGDVISVGADSRDVANEDDAGAVYVFRLGDTWQLEAELVASDALEDAFLGTSVALHEGVVIAGAPGDNASVLDGGAAYLFRRTTTGWYEEQKIVSSDVAEDDLFGHAVDIEGDVAVVSALQHDPLGEDRGAAYVYRLSGGWTEAAKLTADDGEAYDRFGRDVAISGDLVLVGSDDDEPGNLSGAGYLYRRTGAGFVEQAKFEPVGLGTGDRFGKALDLDGRTAIIGAYSDDDRGTAAGAAYFFAAPPLTFDVMSQSLTTGLPFSVLGCGGVPDAPMRLVATRFRGRTVQVVLASGVADGDGVWSGMWEVPSSVGLVGDEITLRLQAFDRRGNLVQSPRWSTVIE